MQHQAMAMITLPESKSYSVVSNSLQSRGLNSPWDSPGQNTRVGSLSLLQGIFRIQESNLGLQHFRQILYQLSRKGNRTPQFSSVQFSHSVVSDSLRPHGLYSPWNSPGQNTGVGSLSLLQGIFPTQGSNPWPLDVLQRTSSPTHPLPAHFTLQFHPWGLCLSPVVSGAHGGGA